VNNLHRRASAWFEEHGLLDEALHHALAAGDLRLAAQQMNAGLREVLNHEDRPTLERWLSLLPEEMIQRSPRLLMIRVWALQFTWRLDLQAKVIQQVEVLLDSGAGAALPVDELQILRGQVLTLRAQQAYFSNQPAQAIDLCQQALALLPPSWTFVRGAAMLYLGMAMHASGQGAEADRLVLDSYELYGDKTDAFALLLLESLGFNYLKSGQLEQSRQIAQPLLQGATQSRIAIIKNWGDYFPGVVHYQRNELEDAAEHFSRIIENRYTAQITAYRDAVAGLALIHQIKGEGAEALQIVESMSQFDLEQGGSEDDRTRSLRARLMLMQGDLEGAGRWADAFTGVPPDQPLFWLEEPQVNRARILVARGMDADLRLALELLDVLDEIAERTHNTRYKIEILALRALALDAQGKSGRADAVLNQATALARMGGFIRVFVDLGPPLQGILRRLDSRSPTGDYVHRLLAAFPDERRTRGNGKTLLPGATGPAQNAPVPAEPLTARERDVLKLLREPLGINEIAEELSLSPSTVKRHIANIYGKLEVNRRWDAVAKAEELSIIPPR
jgi:LuxR family maltose regulon positive regulatory protein